MEATDTFDLQAETLRGDVRDVLLTHVRSMETPWSKLSEYKQQDIIRAIEKCAQKVVRDSVKIVAGQGFPQMVVSTGKWAVKDGIKLEVNAPFSVENVTRLGEHGTGSAILVLCEAGEFFGERQEVRADPDQPSLDMEGDEDGDEDGDPAGESGEVVTGAAETPRTGRGRRPAAGAAQASAV